MPWVDVIKRCGGALGVAAWRGTSEVKPLEIQRLVAGEKPFLWIANGAVDTKAAWQVHC
jgi:hypothetical protein